MELLAPAGGLDAFYAALAAGADAIYCGVGHDFNARRSAANFTAETFEEACRAAHVAGVRVYVTQNVVIKDEEMPKALAAAWRAWRLGADALIVQDLGLAAELRRRFPQIELHASTQMNLHDARGAVFARDVLGMSRVTLSRELSLPEIATIAATGVEVENFGHGALCFCYSGLCLMSSLKGPRSANRGLCAQPCRLPFDLVDEEGRSLSAPGAERALCPKDYCTIDDLPALAEAGLASLKVEGRMKTPDYVWGVTRAYRTELDELDYDKGDRYICHKSMTNETDELVSTGEGRRRLLKRVFNRDFTDGYLHGTSDNSMMSYERSNNRGELVGTVVSSRDLGTYKRATPKGADGRMRVRTHRAAEARVLLDKPVGKGDILELRSCEDSTQFVTAPAPQAAGAGEELTLQCALPVPAGSAVRVIRSQAIKDVSTRAARPAAAFRRPVNVRVVARLGEPFSVTLACADGEAEATAQGPVVEPARTVAITREDLIEHVDRMGGSPFVAASFDVELGEGVGMGFAMVHKVRARACHQLEEALAASVAEREESTSRAPRQAAITAGLMEERCAHGLADPRTYQREEPEICALVPTPEVAEVACAAGATRLYATDAALAEGSWPEGVIPCLDEVCREGDHAHIDPFVQHDAPVAVGSLSELALARERGAHPEVRPCIPVHNESALVHLEALGAAGIWLSPELSLAEIAALAPRATVPVGLTVLGHTRAMTSEHCVLQVAGQCVHDCARCKLRTRDLGLVDIDGLRHPVRTDLHGRSRIYFAEPLDATPELPDLLAAGVTRYLVDCTLLDVAETSAWVSRASAALAAALEGRELSPRLEGSTTGHLFDPVD